MVFELVRRILSQGSPLYWRWTHEPTMENASLGDQQGDTLHGTGDVSEAFELEQNDWSDLARAPITKQPDSLLSTDRNSHIGASNAGLESFPSNGHPNTPQDSSSSEDETKQSKQDRLLRKRSRKSLLNEIPSSTTNWDAPPSPVPHVDANARSSSARIADQPEANVRSINAGIADHDANVRSSDARIAAQTAASVCSVDARTAAQYAEERTSHAKWQRNGAAMQVESTDFPIQNVELTQSNSIQNAYTPIPMPTQHSEDLSLRRSNVDGNFYSHEFDHEKVIEVMDESASQTSSVDQPWNRVIETQPRRIRPDPFQIPNGSLRECTLLSVRVQELAEPVRIPSHHSSNDSLWERTLPSAHVQELVEPSQSQNGSLRECSPPGVRVQEIAEPPQWPNSLEFWQAHPMDELRQMAAELNRRLELRIAGLRARRSGPTNEFYPTQPTEQDIPFVVRPDPYPVAH